MPKKILVVDDDLTNVTLIQNRLEQKGFEVILARDGDVGLEKAKKEKPDLIILDVEMPRMNGYTFIVELRKDESAKVIPILVLTAHEEVQPVFELKGVKGYLLKPIDFDKLFEKIEKALLS